MTTTEKKPTLGELLKQRNGLAYALASEYVAERWGEDADAPEMPPHVREFLRLDAAVQAETHATIAELAKLGLLGGRVRG